MPIAASPAAASTIAAFHQASLEDARSVWCGFTDRVWAFEGGKSPAMHCLWTVLGVNFWMLYNGFLSQWFKDSDPFQHLCCSPKLSMVSVLVVKAHVELQKGLYVIKLWAHALEVYSAPPQPTDFARVSAQRVFPQGEELCSSRVEGR